MRLTQLTGLGPFGAPSRHRCPRRTGNTLKPRWSYAEALYKDPAATLDDLREAVTTLEDAERIARCVLGGAHPDTVGIENDLRHARAALAAREGDDVSSVSICGLDAIADRAKD